MAGRIVLFGATGYTGELTARALVARGARPLLVARSRERVGALADELGGLDSAVADVARPRSIAKLVEAQDVLVTTVGPFARHGVPAVRAAISAGAHYIDSTGEPTFVRDIFERYGPEAASSGSGLLTAMGYDYVPGNLAAGLALRDAGERAVRVDVGYFAGAPTGGQISGGTRASAAGMFAEPAHGFHKGRLVTERAARRLHRFEVGGRTREAISIGATEQFALPRVYPQLREVGVYLGWFGPASRPLQVASAATELVTKLPFVSSAIGLASEKLVKGSSGGPDAATRAKARSRIIAVASDRDGLALGAVQLEGASPYDFTAGMLAWSAMRVAAGGLRGAGALGPIDAFGLDELERGVREAGIARGS
ncbi:MAG: hypothetical protein QOG15_1068 [Solirubrobacteraceae bacterium]|jgi:short subunit dehydrogenase-like uncharacterized protein|nr:hypothetical protein [Solirubrobacteraceae bacterium]